MEKGGQSGAIWTGNRVHRLRELIGAAFSATDAARILSEESGQTVTRDAAGSKARALGLSFAGRAGRPRSDGATPGDAEPKQPPSPRPMAEKPHARIRWSILRPRPMPLPLHELRTIPARGTPRPLLAWDPGCCAWPVSDWLEAGSARTPYCCAPAAPGRSYCPDHLAIAYQPAAA